ncbi:ion transporter, partial [archaeon]
MDNATFHELAKRVHRKQPREVVDIIFHAVGGQVGYIDAQCFVAACTLLDVIPSRMVIRDLDVTVDRVRYRIARFMNHPIFCALLDVAIITIGLTELILDNSSYASADEAAAESSSSFVVSIIILLVFCAECVLKVFGMGLKRYWADGFNRLDVLVIAGNVVSFALFDGANASAAASRVRTMFFLRLVRALRLMNRISSVAEVLRTVSQITPLLWRIVMVLFITMYCTAIIGVEAFSGLLNPDDPAVANSSYARNNQTALNFDTFPKSFVSQFAVLITTQSPIIFEGLMASTNSWWPAIYFAFVYVIIVCIVSNILIALLLQSYGISATHVRMRQAGYVEIWEHLLARAQHDLNAIDPARYPHPYRWQFHRRNAFLTVNESLFGESLVLDFEVDTADMRGFANKDARTSSVRGNGGGASALSPRPRRDSHEDDSD